MNKPFYLGLCMAGAVSAGAYTAGVIDYLIESLEEWEKKRGEDNVPSHRVVIPVVGGASAGGMTGIILSSMINYPVIPVSAPGKNIMEEHAENKLYHSWVDLLGEDMFSLMLSLDDIQDNKIYSLLNSNFIQEVANRALLPNEQSWQVARPYFDNELKIFVTMTNLKGFPFDVGFKGNDSTHDYIMIFHNDFGAFQLNTENPDSGWNMLNFKNNINVDLAQNAAMATGAFPLGLRSRSVTRDGNILNALPFVNKYTSNMGLSNPYEALMVDGGMINNEPFERVQDLLRVKTGESDTDNSDYKSFQSTVLMIDPFPSEMNKAKGGDELMDVVKQTFSAMLTQLGVKPDVLKNAMKDDDASRFLVAPKRYFGGDVATEGSRAIACGFLGGFGGFLHKEFRIHDYFLGRSNCETFLRNHFVVPVDTQNPIFVEGYDKVDKERFLAEDDKAWMQIIPLFKAPTDFDELMPSFASGENWPKRKRKEIENFQGPISRRLNKLLRAQLNVKWPLGKLGTWVGGSMLSKKALEQILKSMGEYELLED